jgi:ABC-type Fe3+ transport system permease subunit
MVRAIIEEMLLFVLPFCLFAAYLVAKRRNPLDVAHWSRHAFLLAVAGLVLAIGLLVIEGFVAKRDRGAYEPPHLENGVLVPGRFR